MAKTVKIWLVLLPVILIIGVVLYMQSYNNQKELENQLIRSVEASKNDIVRALSDYYTRVEAYFVRQGSARSAISRPNARTRLEATKLDAIVRTNFHYSNPRLVNPSSEFDNSLRFKNGLILKKGLVIHIDNLYTDYNLEEFKNAFHILEDSFEDPTNSLIVDLEIPVPELLRKQESNKIFEHFFITFKDGTVLYPPEDAGIKLFLPTDIAIDSLGVIDSGTDVIRLNYSGIQSRAYVSPIPMEDQQLYAVGVLSEDTYKKVGMRLDFSRLSMLILFLLILIALIPILGVMNLSPGDNLTQNKVTQVGISLLCLSIIIGYSLSQFRNKPKPVDEQAILADEIEIGLRDSLELFKNTLELGSSFEQLEKIASDFNELIAFKSNGYAEKIYFRNTPDGPKLIDFGRDTSAIDLSQRAYFSIFKEEKYKTATFLDSHYSRTDGQLESVISKNFDASQEAGLSGIKAITFKLKVNPAYSDHYRFLVLKENGKILLKSNKISSPIAQIQEGINREKWGEISSLMQNNSSSKSQILTSLYLNGNFYTGILKRIDTDDFDERVWLLFLVNENISHSLASLSSAESISLLSIYFLSLLLSLLIQKLSRRPLDKQGTKAFLYSWLEPSTTNLPRLNYLIIAYFFYAIGLVVTYYLADITHSDMLLLLICSGFLISFVNLSTSINAMTFDDFAEFKIQRYSMRSVILGGINLVLLVFIVFWNWQLSKPVLFLTLLACSIIAIWFLVIKSKARPTRQPKSITIPAFLGLWFLIIGFLPGYFIQSKTQLYEQALWNASGPELVQEQCAGPDLFYSQYELKRRKLLTWIADPFDQKIKNFIAPNQCVFKMAMEKGGLASPSGSAILLNALMVLTMLVLFILFANVIQNIIFYPLLSLKRKRIDFSKPKLFLCCPQAGLVAKTLQDKLKGTHIETINLLEADIAKRDLIPYNTPIVHIENIHCRKNPLEIIPLLNRLIDKNKSIIISSGKSWDELFSRINEMDDQVIFAETFTGFDFHVIPINLQCFKAEPHSKKHVLLHQAENEEKMQLKIAQFADIWSELNFQEKLVCYSFSMERFLNKSRKHTIYELIRKGILITVKDPSEQTPLAPENSQEAKEIDNGFVWQKYEFFSRLFQTYILAYVSKEEIKTFQQFESKNGNSSMIQVSAISFVLICFGLISIFDRTFLNEVYAYLTGTLGLLGSLYAMLNRGFSGFKFEKK